MRALLENIGIALKLYGATAAMLGTLGLVIALGVFGSRLVGVRVTEMAALASASERATAIDRDLEALNAALLRALFAQDDASAKWVTEHAPAIKAELKTAAAGSPNAQLRAQIVAVAAEVDGLAEASDHLLAAIAKTDEQRSDLSEASSTLKQAQNALARAVKAKDDAANQLAQARLEARIERLRSADWRAQALTDRDSGAVVDQVVADILDALKPLQGYAGEATDLAAAVKDYAAKSQATVGAIVDQSDAYTKDIGPRATHIGALVAEARKSVAAAFDDSREGAQTFIHRADVALQAIGAFILTFGVIAAALIVRSIASPLARLTAGLRRLAAGEFDFHLPVLAPRTEIGQIVAAVEGFRSALREKARDDAAEEIRRQAAEHEAAARDDAERRRQAEEQAGVMRMLGEGLSRMAAKTLSYRLDAPMPSGYAKLRDDFNTAIAQLESALSTVKSTSDIVRGGAHEIAGAANDLSSRTEHQAQELDRTSGSLSSVTETVRRTAEGARRAREVAASTRAVAQKGGDIVKRAVQAMGRIETSSNEIGKIIGVIDEIAFQTNLLALNAGVEAARAGDSGRGFAVVAQEVRALAQRSADAAKQIKTLVSNSSAQVGDGVKLVAATGEALDQILAEIAEVTSAIGEIAGSAAEQAAGLESINKAVVEMDHMTQQNAAMVEEASAATRSLRQESEELARLIGEFDLGGQKAAPSRRVQRAA